MLKSFDNNYKQRSLIDEYSMQVVRSQLKRRAETAISDKHINSKNIVELKSYFISSLINKLALEIEKTLNCADGFQADGDRVSKQNVEQHGAEKIVTTMRSMLSFLHQIQDIAQLEAGILSVSPETLQIEDIIGAACVETKKFWESDGAKFVLDLNSEPLCLLGDRNMLIKMFSNIFWFAAHGSQPNDKIIILIERLSELDLVVAIPCPNRDLSEVDITRLLTTNNLVENAITIGSENILLALPIAKALAELHSGELSISNKAGAGIFIRVTLPVHKTTETALLSP